MQVRLRRMFRAANPPTAVLASGEARDGWGRHFKIMMQHTSLVIMAIVLLCGGIAGTALTLFFAIGIFSASASSSDGPQAGAYAFLISSILAVIALIQTIRRHLRQRSTPTK